MNFEWLLKCHCLLSPPHTFISETLNENTNSQQMCRPIFNNQNHTPDVFLFIFFIFFQVMGHLNLFTKDDWPFNDHFWSQQLFNEYCYFPLTRAYVHNYKNDIKKLWSDLWKPRYNFAHKVTLNDVIKWVSPIFKNLGNWVWNLKMSIYSHCLRYCFTQLFLEFYIRSQ